MTFPQASDAFSSLEARSGAPLDLMMLYERYKRPLHTYVRHLLGNQEDADDVTQEVFLRTFAGWKNLSDHDHFASCLYHIATNLCIDQLRKRKRIFWGLLTRRSTDPHLENASSHLLSDNGGIPGIFERELTQRTLTKMPRDYAVVLLMSAAQGIPYQVIATIVGISPQAAATRISRAKCLFARQYEQLSKEEANKQTGKHMISGLVL